MRVNFQKISSLTTSLNFLNSSISISSNKSSFDNLTPINDLPSSSGCLNPSTLNFSKYFDQVILKKNYISRKFGVEGIKICSCSAITLDNNKQCPGRGKNKRDSWNKESKRIDCSQFERQENKWVEVSG